jgi:hypothetical protein
MDIKNSTHGRNQKHIKHTGLRTLREEEKRVLGRCRRTCIWNDSTETELKKSTI